MPARDLAPRPGVPLALELLDPAVGRGLVVAPARDLGAVADPVVAGVIGGDLDDELRPQRDPLEVAVAGPAARVAHAALSGLVWRELLDQLALALGAQARGVADGAQLAALVVEAEDQRADGVRLLAGAPADDDRVDRPHALDLRHALALPGQVGRLLALGDHALGALQPWLGLAGVLRRRRQVDGL